MLRALQSPTLGSLDNTTAVFTYYLSDSFQDRETKEKQAREPLFIAAVA